MDIARIVDGAIAETLAAVYHALKAGAAADEVASLCDSVASNLWEVIRAQTDDALAVREFRLLAAQAQGGEKARRAERRGRGAHGKE